MHNYLNKLTLISLLMLSACSHPLETSIPNAVSAPSSTYQIAYTSENPSDNYLLSHKLIQERLNLRGYTQSAGGQLYVTIALSERPADSLISVQQDQHTQIISNSKGKGFLKKCKDHAYKLSLIMHDMSNGEVVYQASATKRRCNADKESLINSLVKAVTSSLLPK